MPDISSMLKAVKLGGLKRLCVKETLYTHFASSLIGQGEVSSFMKYKCDTKYLVGVPNFIDSFFASGMNCILDHQRERMKYWMNICGTIGAF